MIKGGKEMSKGDLRKCPKCGTRSRKKLRRLTNRLTGEPLEAACTCGYIWKNENRRNTNQ